MVGGAELEPIRWRANRDVVVLAPGEARNPVAGGEHEIEDRRAEADQGLESGSDSQLLWGRGGHRSDQSAAFVEEEARQGAFDHFLGHPLGDLKVAGAHGDVVEGDDPDQAPGLDDRQPADPVLDHQRSCLL